MEQQFAPATQAIERTAQLLVLRLLAERAGPWSCASRSAGSPYQPHDERNGAHG